jgi:hypothetical protein
MQGIVLLVYCCLVRVSYDANTCKDSDNQHAACCRPPVRQPVVPDVKKARADIVLSPTQAQSAMNWQPVEIVSSPLVTYQPVQFVAPRCVDD